MKRRDKLVGVEVERKLTSCVRDPVDGKLHRGNQTMSKAIARSPQSYQNEELLVGMLPDLLRCKGFTTVRVSRTGQMKFVEARCSDGSDVKFWLKQGWTDARDHSAVQFGMFTEGDFAAMPDSQFVDYVAARAASAKKKGATHALLVHMVDSAISNYVALLIGDIEVAYRRQISSWPRRARNSKTPTLYFEDNRDRPDAICASVVTALEVPLESISGYSPVEELRLDSKKITAEIEVRMGQVRFRHAVAGRCGWRCVVSGCALREVLDAAHLPGRDWRQHNSAADGVLIRTDLHRLLDRGLAEIRDGRFWLSKEARVEEYELFHGRELSVTKA